MKGSNKSEHFLSYFVTLILYLLLRLNICRNNKRRYAREIREHTRRTELPNGGGQTRVSENKDTMKIYDIREEKVAGYVALMTVKKCIQNFCRKT
jgi:hypothetical protein